MPYKLDFKYQNRPHIYLLKLYLTKHINTCSK